MSKAMWLLAFVALLAFAGAVSAQPAPAVTPASSQATAPAAVAGHPAPAATLLSQIFAAPVTEGISTVPEPAWKSSCTVVQCKQSCKAECVAEFCTPVCINTGSCLCGCFCN
jgi:hypothetical protein